MVSTLFFMAKRRRANSSKKRRDRCSSIDRIGLLPDEVLASILSHLTLKEATACSLLCRRWRYMWTFTTKLHFDGINSLLKVKVGDKNRGLVLVEERSKYVRWVNNVLELHKKSNSSVEEFKIFFNLNESNGKWIDRWLRYALDRKVHRLELNLTNDASWCSSRRDHYTFPYNLMHTNKNTSSESFFDSSYFKFLKTISLNNVKVNGETLEFFLSNCPLLEDMSVSYSVDLLTLTVIGPSSQLKRLEISHCRNLTSVEIRDANLVSLKYKGLKIPFILENVPLLVDLYVGEVVDHCTKDVVSMFSGIFPQLETCTIDLKIQYLSWRKTRLMYSRVNMCKLKQLVVLVRVNGGRSLLPLTKLIRAAPCLQRFVPVVSRGRYKFVEGELQNISRCYAELKEVEFVGYSGMTGDRELVMHLANNAAALEKIVIDPCRPHETRFGRMYAYTCGDWDDTVNEDNDARTRAHQQLINVMPARIKLDILAPGIMSRFRPDII